MRRFSRSRTQSWSTAVCTNFDMDSAPPRTPTKPRGYYTGFPEPFCGSRFRCPWISSICQEQQCANVKLTAGNTTLRHPDADTSPNASISSGDIDADRVFVRSRRTFLSKHKWAVSYGKLSGSNAESSTANGELNITTESRPITGRSYKDEGDGDSVGRSSSSAHSNVAFPTIVVTRDSNGQPLPPTASVTDHRSGLLRKLRSHN